MESLDNSPHQDLIGKMIPPHNGYIIADLRIRCLPDIPGGPHNRIWGTVGPVSLKTQKTFGLIHPGVNCSYIRCRDCGKRASPQDLYNGRCGECAEIYRASYPTPSMRIDVEHEARMRALAHAYHLPGA